MAEERSIIPFILVTKDNVPTFAAVPLIERWQRAVEKIEVENKKEMEIVKYGDIQNTLKNTDQKKIVVLADYVLDDMTLEFAAEKLFNEIKDDEIAFPTYNNENAPIFVAGKNTFGKISSFDFQASSDPSKEFSEFCKNESGISATYHPVERAFWAKLTDKKSAKKAQWGMLKYLKHRPGGLVAKYINRPFSMRISRILVNFSSITPNFVTIFASVIALVAVAMLFQPGWFWAVMAAIIIHINSILDDVDGEIARMRKQESSLGAWLDSISDETLGLLIYIAIGYHLYVTPPAYAADNSIVFLFIGIFTGVASYTYALTHWHCKIKHGLGFYFWWECYKPRKEVQRSTSIFSYIKKLFWKESVLLAIVFACIFNFLDIFLIIACIPATVNFCLLFIHIFIKRARW